MCLFINEYMTMYKKNRATEIDPSSGLAMASLFRSGVRNIMIQLVDCDHDSIEEWVASSKLKVTKPMDSSHVTIISLVSQ